MLQPEEHFLSRITSLRRKIGKRDWNCTQWRAESHVEQCHFWFG